MICTQNNSNVLKQKGGIICRLENGELNSFLAKKFGVGHLRLQMILKNRNQIKEWFNSTVFKPRRFRKSRRENIDQVLIQWFQIMSIKTIPMLQEKSKFGILNFNFAVSWISRLKAKCNIVLEKISGESSSVGQSSTTDDDCMAKSMNDSE